LRRKTVRYFLESRIALKKPRDFELTVLMSELPVQKPPAILLPSEAKSLITDEWQ